MGFTPAVCMGYNQVYNYALWLRAIYVAGGYDS